MPGCTPAVCGGTGFAKVSSVSSGGGGGNGWSSLDTSRRFTLSVAGGNGGEMYGGGGKGSSWSLVIIRGDKGAGLE